MIFAIHAGNHILTIYHITQFPDNTEILCKGWFWGGGWSKGGMDGGYRGSDLMCNWKSKTYGGYSDAGAGGGAIRGHAICRSLQIACLPLTANLLSAKFWWVCRYFLCDSWSPNIAPICPLSLRKRTMWSNCHNVCLWYQTIQGSKQWKWWWM